jgi:hypothetical protein
MEYDVDRPNNFVGQQQNADAAQYAPYAMPGALGSRCYYCGEPSLVGSIVCKRCSDWMYYDACLKAKKSMWFGRVSLLTFVVGIPINVFLAYLGERGVTAARVIFALTLNIFLVSVVFGIISVTTARDAKRLAALLPVSGEYDLEGLYQAMSAGKSLGVLSVALFIAGVAAIAIYIIWLLYYAATHMDFF